MGVRESLGTFDLPGARIIASTLIAAVSIFLSGPVQAASAQMESKQELVDQWIDRGAHLAVLEHGQARIVEHGDVRDWMWDTAPVSEFVVGQRVFRVRSESSHRLLVVSNEIQDGGLGLVAVEKDVTVGVFEIEQLGDAVCVRWRAIEPGFDPANVPLLRLIDPLGTVRVVLATDPDSVREAQSIVFVLDASGSMAGAKIESAKRALITATDHLHSDTECALVVLFDCGRVSRELDFGASHERFGRVVSRIQASGGTPLGDALAEAFDYLHANATHGLEHRRIVVLSDGQQTCGRSAAAVITGWEAELRAAQRFDIIGIDLDSADNEALAELARLAGGTIVNEKPEELEERTGLTLRRK